MYNDRELLAKTLMAEAGNQGYLGMLAAGSVIMNRVNSGGYGKGIQGVIMKPGAFSPWNSVTGAARGEQGQNMAAIKPSEEAYRVADQLLSGQAEDPTGGATHFYNPDISSPSWGVQGGGNWTKIGAHVFGRADDPNKGPSMLVNLSSKPSAAASGAADTMAASGKGGGTVTPDQIAQQAQMQSQGQQPEQPRGLLGNFFGDPDRMAALAMALNSMRLNPDPNLSAVLSAQMKERREERKSALQVNKTADWLESQGLDKIAQGVRSGAVPVGSAVGMYQASVKAASDPNVQSSSLLPDQSGTIMTMRDGSLRVITIGGETLEGQAAADFVRQAQERNVQYQSDINRARSSGQFLGRTEAAEIAAAPSTISTADTTLKYIDAVRNHPGLEQGTGFSSTFNVVPGTPGYDFQNRVKQISSGAFLTAIQDLRGMGALSNSEGETATAAVNRMDTATSKEEFLSALDDYQSIVEKGRQNALAKISGQSQQVAPAAPPATPRIRYDEQGNRVK
jgi:hypothetical protein